MPLVERSLDGRTFVVVSYDRTPVLQKELRWLQTLCSMAALEALQALPNNITKFSVELGVETAVSFQNSLVFLVRPALMAFTQKATMGSF